MDEKNSTLSLLNWLCWLTASVATAGSLFFSEILEYPPCALCWYQRIAMYPLVVIFFVGTYQSARSTFDFSFPLVIIGWLIAVYHNLIQLGVVPETASPCREGIPCSINYIEWFGFITIPLLSFVAFSLLAGLLITLKRNHFYER